MLLKKTIPIPLAILLANCNAPVVEKCRVGDTQKYEATFGHHGSIKSNEYSNDAVPENDLKDLHEGLYQKAGEYALSIKVGAGSIQEIDVVADTGSSDLVISNHSYHPGPSAINLNTALNLAYGSCKGISTLYQDKISLQCGATVEQSFAFIDSTKSSCPNIMGLAYKQLSITQSSFYDNIVEKSGMKNMFSMLMCGPKSGSQVVIGGHIDNAPIASLQYTPIIQESYYVVEAKSMGIKGGQIIAPFSKKQPKDQMVIMDSGTTLNMIPPSMHDAIVTAVKKAAPHIPADFFTSIVPSDDNYTIHESVIGDLSALPTFTLTLAGSNGSDLVLELPPQIYLKNMGNNNLIFGFRETKGIIIFGQAMMENYYVVFDRENKRIGFAANTGFCK